MRMKHHSQQGSQQGASRPRLRCLLRHALHWAALAVDVRGRMGRRDYLLFLMLSALSLALILALFWMQRDNGRFWTNSLIAIAIFYLPVTSAGARRLNDAGHHPGQMLLPLLPAAVTVGVIALTGFLTRPVSGLLLILSAMFLSQMLAALILIILTGVVVATLIAFSHVMGLLLLPSKTEVSF